MTSNNTPATNTPETAGVDTMTNTARFYLTPAGGTEREVTMAEYVQAERSENFRNTLGYPDQPATQAFGGRNVSGRMEGTPDLVIWATRLDGSMDVHTSRAALLAAVRDAARRAGDLRNMPADFDEMTDWAADILGLDIARHEVPAGTRTVWTTSTGDDFDLWTSEEHAHAELSRYADRYGDDIEEGDTAMDEHAI